MKKFVAFAVAAVVAGGSTFAMAQCASCNQGVQFSPAPAYSAPVSQPVYSAPVSQPVYSAPMTYQSAPMVVESAPMVVESAPMVSSGCGSCACGGATVDGGMMVQDMSYGTSESTLTVGSVINGETVVSVGESVVIEGDSSEAAASEEGNTISGDVEPTSDGGDIIDAPTVEDSEISPPEPDDADADAEVTEGDA